MDAHISLNSVDIPSLRVCATLEHAAIIVSEQVALHLIKHGAHLDHLLGRKAFYRVLSGVKSLDHSFDLRQHYTVLQKLKLSIATRRFFILVYFLPSLQQELLEIVNGVQVVV